ncbi:MAG: hypothetical protein IJD60_00560, partial [Clostridia bacterium]|nr:hypothetical protein [Clostridia bacterium]
MKNILRILALCLLLALPACALAAGETSCYWQLEAIEVEHALSQAYGPATAETDVQNVNETDPAVMTEIVRGVKHVTLDVTRENGGYNAHGEYTLAGVPAVVPGAASARLTITANTKADEHSFYLYSSILVDGRRTLRVRETGAWVHRVYFPRVAPQGAVQRITLDSREIHDFARTQVTYVYRAHPGVMVIDTNGDVVLYDLNGNVIKRIPQTVEDILPVFTQESGNVAGGKTIFAAEEQEDGSLIVRFDPDSGLTEDELIRLIRAAASGETDATSAATFVSTLEADENDATLYIAPNTDLSDDVLRALLRAASGKALSVDAVSEAIDAGEVALIAEPTATPAPLTYSQLREKALNPQAFETAAPAEIAALSETADGAEAAQALLLYNDSGVQGIVLT